MDVKVIDWDKYADEDIERFLGELANERENRKVGKRNALKERIEEMLKEQGLSVEEVFSTVRKGRARVVKGKREAEERPVKYRNPADTSQPGQAWGGSWMAH